MEKWTAISFGTDDVNAEETAVRQRLHAALETAVAAYMAESKRQDIVEIEMFPTPQ
jgi:L-rhamnose isomerase